MDFLRHVISKQSLNISVNAVNRNFKDLSLSQNSGEAIGENHPWGKGGAGAGSG